MRDINAMIDRGLLEDIGVHQREQETLELRFALVTTVLERMGTLSEVNTVEDVLETSRKLESYVLGE